MAVDQPNASRVFVGNLHPSTTVEEIIHRYSKYGVIQERVARVRHCAFVQFMQPECAAAAIEGEHGKMLHGWPMEVRHATSRGQRHDDIECRVAYADASHSRRTPSPKRRARRRSPTPARRSRSPVRRHTSPPRSRVSPAAPTLAPSVVTPVVACTPQPIVAAPLVGLLYFSARHVCACVPFVGQCLRVGVWQQPFRECCRCSL